MPENRTAKHKIVTDGGGYRFIFYCDVSDAHVCTTGQIYQGDSEEEALLAAWQAEGREHFNRCHKCGKWVIDAMFNADALECVKCAPWENTPEYCKFCGSKVSASDAVCPRCGKLLIYGGSFQ